jgi:hypothetical protein
MTQPLTLYLPLRTFEDLFEAAHGRGKKTTVSKADLLALLMDHARVVAKLQDMHVPMEEDYAGSNEVRKARKG